MAWAKIWGDCWANSEPSIKGLAEYNASASNLRRIQVKEIVKEVEDYLKTYSSTGIDIYWLNRIARLYLKDDDAVNAEAFINKVLFFVNTTVTTRANRAGQKNSENLLVFQVRVSKTLKGSTQTLKSVSSFGEDKGFLCSVTGQKKVQQIVQQEKVSNSGFDRVIILSDFNFEIVVMMDSLSMGFRYSSSGPRRQETIGDTIAQTGFENVSKTSNDSLLAGVNTP
ncbi:hypothetical protein Tco_1246338 [Tanacetum coccineum]